MAEWDNHVCDMGRIWKTGGNDMNDQKTLSTRKLLLSASIAAALGLALPALAAGSPTYTPNSSMKTAAPANGANVVSDSDITNQVKSRLTSMSNLQDASIDVNTMKGEVTLTGTVSSKEQEQAAKSAAQGIPGVTKVKDELSVSAKPPSMGEHRLMLASNGSQHVVSDSWITTKVKSDLLADKVTQGFDVKVATTNGVVALTGSLPNEAAVNHAKAVALQVDGVKSVDTTGLNVSRQ
jgi:hyperosmotically inducible protein